MWWAVVSEKQSFVRVRALFRWVAGGLHASPRMQESCVPSHTSPYPPHLPAPRALSPNRPSSACIPPAAAQPEGGRRRR